MTPAPTATQSTLQAALTSFRRRAGEAGLIDVAYCSVDSPVGRLTVAATDRGLVRIGFGDEEGVVDELARRISPRVLKAPARLDRVRRELDEYFEGDRREFDMPLDWTLAGPFCRRVLDWTSRIPYGDVASYQQVARAIGAPAASRAVGNALGANPIAVVVPCHRVVRTGGSLGGYGGGLPRKAWLLRLEGVTEPATSRAVARFG